MFVLAVYPRLEIAKIQKPISIWDPQPLETTTAGFMGGFGYTLEERICVFSYWKVPPFERHHDIVLLYNLL